MIQFYRALGMLINLIEFLILARILLSLFNIRMNNIVGEFIGSMTEPILSPARRLLAKLNVNTGMLDFSPIVAILFLRIFYNVIGRILLF